MDLLNETEDSSPCSSTLMILRSATDRLRLEREERATARLQRQRQRQQEWRRSEQTEVRQARRRACNHEHRAVERLEARQARLDRRRFCDHKHTAAEQPKARAMTLILAWTSNCPFLMSYMYICHCLQVQVWLSTTLLTSIFKNCLEVSPYCSNFSANTSSFLSAVKCLNFMFTSKSQSQNIIIWSEDAKICKTWWSRLASRVQ